MGNKTLPCFPLIYLLYLLCSSEVCHAALNHTISIGVILDTNSWVGKTAWTALKLAAHDVNYHTHLLNGTRLLLHLSEARTELEGASAAIDLLERKVVAIIGPQTSEVAEFISHLGDAAKVPVISFSATSPLLSHHRFPYFVRMAHSDGAQMKVIAALAKAYDWRRIVFVHPDDHFGSGAISSLSNALRDVGSEIEYTCAISPTADKRVIREVLYKLMTMESRVFVAHMRSNQGLDLFREANEVGMMEAGYVWITTDGFTSLWDVLLNSSTMAFMQGMLGVKTDIPNSDQLKSFTKRWKRQFRLDNPDVDNFELNQYGILAYDTVWMIAGAIGNLGINASFSLLKATNPPPIIRNAEIMVSQQGKHLLQEILASNFVGLSGSIQFRHGELNGYSYDIVNLVGKSYHIVGKWTNKPGNDNKDLASVIWPGRSTQVPRGWVIPSNSKRLKIGVPIKAGWKEFVEVKVDPARNETRVTGFCRDVFDAVLKELGYALPYDLITFANDGNITNSYDKLVRQVYHKKFDAVLGDTTILAHRSKIVDFTQPFSESGFVMVVATDRDEGIHGFQFFSPFTPGLWWAIAALVILTGIVVRFLEHPEDPFFEGGPIARFVALIWFAVCTIIIPPGDKIKGNLSRMIVVFSLFMALVLISSYTANLSSRLTIAQMKPRIESVEAVIASGVPVGYQNGSFVADYLHEHFGIAKRNLKGYGTPEEFEEALSKGPNKGGVAAIFDEIPYVRVFLSSRCSYTMVGPTYKTGGFGFVFPKGSPLMPDISTVVLNLSENALLQEIEAKYFNNTSCSRPSSTKLGLNSCWGLFLIAGVLFLLALMKILRQDAIRNRAVDPDVNLISTPSSSGSILLTNQNTSVPPH